ncbi:MAG: hypothetical protein LRY63_06490 [Nitrincola sp.]|nr:hypothetical protein [Nitrincola sp.]
MNIAATGTSMSVLNFQMEYAAKVNKMVVDQMETQGEMIVNLIPNAPAGVKTDPTSAVGQIIDVQV